jgi:cytochrome oxidase Cu insertion factor (SCO1/SenC/PrrC family)
MPYSPKDKYNKSTKGFSSYSASLAAIVITFLLTSAYIYKSAPSYKPSEPMSAFHQLEATDIDGKPISFDQYAGKVVLVINVASA